MRNLKLAAAAAIALLCLAPSLAVAGVLHHDGDTIDMIDDGPLLDDSGNHDDKVDNNGVGDESMLLADGPVVGPHLLDCRVIEGIFKFDCQFADGAKADGIH